MFKLQSREVLMLQAETSKRNKHPRENPVLEKEMVDGKLVQVQFEKGRDVGDE